MRAVIFIILAIIIYRQLGTLLNFNQSLINIPTQIAAFASGYLLIAQFYNSLTNYRTIRNGRTYIPRITNFQPIEFEPLMIRFEQHIIRIPLEDRVDFNIDDNHNVHNKTIKRTATMAINELKKS